MTRVDAAPVGGRRLRGPTIAGFGVADLTVGVLLSAGVVVLVHVDLYASDPHGNLVKALAATSMTLPVIWARRYPMTAAAVAAAGASINWLVVGHFIRCGAAVPAAFWLACAVGLRLRGRQALFAMVLVLVDLQALCLGDAALIPATIIPLAPAAVAFWFAGRTIRLRGEIVHSLAVQNQQLVATRERTAQLAVDNDRRRISEGLDKDLHERLGELAGAAALGRAQVDDPPSAAAAFGAIAAGGRDTLAQMRDVVDALRDDAPRRPAPDLAGLGDLVRRHGGTLTVDGARRPLPSGVELSGYRVVEQLLRTFRAEADTLNVYVHFGVDQLELRVTGRLPVELSGPEVSVARNGVEVHGGSLVADRLFDQLRWVARVPLPAG